MEVGRRWLHSLVARWRGAVSAASVDAASDPHRQRRRLVARHSTLAADAQGADGAGAARFESESPPPTRNTNIQPPHMRST
eukprot:2961173-Prymnesium_polylepis.1